MSAAQPASGTVSGRPSRTPAASVLAPIARRTAQFGLGIAVVGTVWQVVTAADLLPAYILPAPRAVLAALHKNAALITTEAFATLSASLIGLFLGTVIGVVLAILLAYLPPLNRALMPLVIVLSTAPLIAVIPVLVVALGNGPAPRIIIAAMAATLLTAIYVRRGLDDTDTEGEELLATLDASPWQRLRILQFYAMLPYLFAALRVSVSTCVIQTIVAEWITGTSGLGYLVQIAGASNRPELMWAAVIVAIFLTLALLAILSVVEAVVMPWSASIKEAM